MLVRPAVGARTLLPRSLRVTDTLRRVELDNDSPLCDILPFVQFADKRWTLCVDLVPIEQVYTLVCLYRSYKYTVGIKNTPKFFIITSTILDRF